MLHSGDNTEGPPLLERVSSRYPLLGRVCRGPPFEIMAPIETLMNRLKSVLIVLTFLLSSLSGCIGEDSESDSDETSILLSRAGSVEHNYCKLAPGQGSSNSSDGCPTDDETIEDYWSAITNLTVINQSAGKGVKIHSESGGTMAGTCSSGAIWGWNIRPDNGDTYNTATHTQGDIGLLPYAGEECVLVYHYMGFENKTMHWSLTYEIVDVNVE